MPVLLRAAHVDDLPAGTSAVVTVRGRKIRLLRIGEAYYAFDAGEARMAREVTEADLAWARQKGATEFRAVARGTFVHVALDADRERAEASVQTVARPPKALGA